MKIFSLFLIFLFLFSIVFSVNESEPTFIIRPPTEEEKYELILNHIENKGFELGMANEASVPLSGEISIDNFTFTKEQLEFVKFEANGNDFEIRQSGDGVEIRNSVSVFSKKGISVKRKKIYLDGMDYGLEVLPEVFIENSDSEISLDVEGNYYLYNIIGESVFLIELKNSYEISFPAAGKRIKVNNSFIESGNIKVLSQLKSGTGIRDISIEKKDNYLELEDRNVELKVLSDLEIKQKNIYVGGFQVKEHPESVYDFVKEKTKGEIKDFRLIFKDEKPVYEFDVDKEYKILGFIPITKDIYIEIDGYDGEVKQVKEPWWSWLSSERIELKQEDLL